MIRKNVICMLMLLLLACSSLWAEPLDEEIKNIDSYLKKEIDGLPHPGWSVAIVKDGKVLFQKAYGVEVIGEETPMTIDSAVGIGSLTKSFTALAVMRLVEQGEINLDASIQQYLPWFTMADKEESRDITVRALLSNSSGIPSLDETIWAQDRSENAMETLVRSLSAYSLKRKPGTAFEYCNENWTILGLIIEAVSGREYAAFIQEEILDPLGMTRSTTDINRLDDIYGENPPLNGHHRGYDKAVPADFFYGAQYVPAGMFLKSTARDVAAYMLMYLAGGVYNGQRIISPENVELMWNPVVSTPGFTYEKGGDGSDMSYGFGWFIQDIEGRHLIHHGGATGTTSSFMMFDPANNTGVCLLSNMDSVDPYTYTGVVTLINNILHLLNGEELSDFGIPRQKDPLLEFPFITLNDEFADSLVGTYQGSHGQSMEVELENGEVFGTFYRGGNFANKMKFSFVNPGHIVATSIFSTQEGRVKIGPDGQIKSIIIHGIKFRRRPQGEGFIDVRSPVNGFSSVLPKGWIARWDEKGGLCSNITIPGQKIYLFSEKEGTLKNEQIVSSIFPGYDIVRSGNIFVETFNANLWYEQTFFVEKDGALEAVMVTRSSTFEGSEILCVYTSPIKEFSNGVMKPLRLFMEYFKF